MLRSLRLPPGELYAAFFMLGANDTEKNETRIGEDNDRSEWNALGLPVCWCTRYTVLGVLIVTSFREARSLPRRVS